MGIIPNLKRTGKCPSFARLHQLGAGDGAIVIAMIARMLLFLYMPGKGRVFSLALLSYCLGLLLFYQIPGSQGVLLLLDQVLQLMHYRP